MTVVTESFTAPDGTDITAVGSGIWAYGNGVAGSLFVTSNALRPVVNVNTAWFARRAGTFDNDQYAEAKLSTVAVSSHMGVCVRANNAGTGYLLYASNDEYYLWRRVNYGAVLLRSAYRTFNVNDVIRLEAEGTTLRLIQNGSTFFTTTDSAIASGNPGVSGNGWPATTTFTAIDDWAGGDLNAPPAYTAPYYVAHSIAEGQLLDVTVNKPTGTAAGDILVFIVGRDWATENVTAPDFSWTKNYSSSMTSPDGEGFAVFTKTAGASEPASYTFTSTSQTNTAAILVAYRADLSTVGINVLGALTTNTSNNVSPITVTAAGVTTTVPNTRLLWFAGANPNASGIISGFTAPSGMTERAETSAVVGWSRVVLADQEIAAAGATGDKSGSLTLSNNLNVSGYFSAVIALGSFDVSISDVDSDEIIAVDQTNIVINGGGFGASQGTGSVTLRQGGVSVAQTVNTWADTQIQFDMVVLASGADIKNGAAYIRVTNNSAVYSELEVFVKPRSDQFYTDLTSVATSASERIVAVPDLAAGDQLWIRGEGDVAAPTGLVVNPDASFYFEDGTTPATFEVRVWDSSDSTWGDWSSFSFLSGLAGTSAVGTVNTEPATIVILTGVAAATYLTSVDPGLVIVLSGNQILGAIGLVVVDTGSTITVTGVSATAQIAKLNIWSTILSAQPTTNWVVIIT